MDTFIFICIYFLTLMVQAKVISVKVDNIIKKLNQLEHKLKLNESSSSSSTYSSSSSTEE
jgi:hypothetical protein